MGARASPLPLRTDTHKQRSRSIGLCLTGGLSPQHLCQHLEVSSSLQITGSHLILTWATLYRAYAEKLRYGHFFDILIRLLIIFLQILDLNAEKRQHGCAYEITTQLAVSADFRSRDWILSPISRRMKCSLSHLRAVPIRPAPAAARGREAVPSRQ
ncbi:unnamed protein product [Nezara viridula]|uniref:Uncharacterized protein n=1 Tax=Nezara viridula TaxID=85310 RepID=A0A9P0EAM4_NEZVI|nr:unnamed protein product [Nezara viridula]